MIPNPDKPEKIATKAERQKGKSLFKFVFVSWRQRCFALKCTFQRLKNETR
jgi:hypothetical protein